MPTNIKPASGLHSVLAALLSLLLAGQPLLAASPQAQEPSSRATNMLSPTRSIHNASGILDPDARILHLLNRFSFGPNAQEIADVKQMQGKTVDQKIDNWFDLQLHPDRIPDAQLETRLAEYPALNLPIPELLENFPSGAEIRQTANGKLPLPEDPRIATIYKRHIDLYLEKQNEKDKRAKTQAANIPSATNSAAMSASLSPTATVPPPSMVNKAKDSDSTSRPTAKPSQPLKPSDRPAYADMLVNTVLSLPPAERVNRIFKMQPAEYESFRTNLKGPQKAKLTADLTPAQRELLSDYENPTRTVVEELQSQRLMRDIYSTHQLQEVMTTFWLNHFNVYLHKNDEAPYNLVSYERDVIRPRALGNFEDLLVATAESPAMLLYLDNSSSTGPDSIVAERQKMRAAQGKAGKATPPGLNENYGRELMELHTLGVNGGYTQKDVTEVAKVFTGWTVDRPQLGGSFKFDESRHQPGKKLVLGKKIKENGQQEGLEVLHMLASSPATAKFLSRELAIAFVADNPPQPLIDHMTQTFLKTHGDIPSVLRTMLHSPEFWSPGVYQTKVKTPLEYVVSAARASNADIADPQPLANQLNQMGMPLYACVPPTGYSDTADSWISTGALVTRMNFSLTLAANKFPNIKTSWTVTPAASQQTSLTDQEAEENRLEAELVPTGVSEKTRTAVLEQAGQPQQPVQVPQPMPTSATKSANPQAQAANQQQKLERQDAALAGLLLGSPEFQRR
jgi:uncharacterized protein (DUF1800 family)